MRSFPFTAALLSAGLLFAVPLTAHAQTKPVVVGEVAPDYRFTDIKNTTHSLSDFKGKLVVLEWTNPGCPFVKKYYGKGDMQKLQADAQQKKDTVWIAVNSSGEGKEGYLPTDADFLKQAAKDNSHATYYVRDPKGVFGKLYGAKTTPHMFVIDKKGVVAYQGAIDSIPSPDQADIAKATPYVADALNTLRQGGKPATINTPSYGCGVKYDDHAGTPDPTNGALNPAGGQPVTNEPHITINDPAH